MFTPEISAIIAQEVERLQEKIAELRMLRYSEIKQYVNRAEFEINLNNQCIELVRNEPNCSQEANNHIVFSLLSTNEKIIKSREDRSQETEAAPEEKPNTLRRRTFSKMGSY